MESIFTHYCKTRHLRYGGELGWSEVLTPLLAVKMPRDHIYICFEEILEKYIPRFVSINEYTLTNINTKIPNINHL